MIVNNLVIQKVIFSMSYRKVIEVPKKILRPYDSITIHPDLVFLVVSHARISEFRSMIRPIIATIYN